MSEINTPKHGAERKNYASYFKADQPVRKVAVLTGGGDCPGLNAVLRAFVKTLINKYGILCYGIEDGFLGLIKERCRMLENRDVSAILNLGGTILGSSNKDDPFNHRVRINGEEKAVDVSEACVEYIRHMGWDCLVCIGGDGTLTMAHEFSKMGVPVVGIPKTIDNDLSATDYTFGFRTAVQTATDCIDRLRTTAMSHHRVQVIEIMGRYAGHLALEAGIAGGGDVILIPEMPYDIDVVCDYCLNRYQSGRGYTIVVVAEGAKPVGGGLTVQKVVESMPDPIRLGGVGGLISELIQKQTGLEARATILGHLQRGGSPTASDRILSTKYGYYAAEMVHNRTFDRMVALRGRDVIDVPLADAIHRLKFVEPTDVLIEAARAVGTCFGDQPALLSRIVQKL